MSGWVISRLSSVHMRKAFSCGEPTLDAYLRQQAGQDVKRDLAVCYVLTESGSRVVIGYYTLSASTIELGELPVELRRRSGKYPLVPAVLLGRLAVNASTHSQGYGAVLLADALRRATDAGVGVRLIVVGALHENAVRFYEHFGFQRLTDASMRLFITTDTVRNLYPSPSSPLISTHGGEQGAENRPDQTTTDPLPTEGDPT